MKKFITRAAVVILIGGMSVAIGGCYGPFRLTSKLHHWNGQVSQKKFVNELVFLGMCIIPAYEICILGDGLIFNSIEWWGGRNPISMKDGQQEEVKFAYEGQEYKVTKTKDQMTIALVNSDQKVDFRYFPEEKSWYQMNGENKVKVVEMKGKQVYTYLPNAKTLVFDESNMEEVETQVMSDKLHKGDEIRSKGFHPNIPHQSHTFCNFYSPNISPVLYHIYTYKYVYHCQDL